MEYGNFFSKFLGVKSDDGSSENNEGSVNVDNANDNTGNNDGSNENDNGKFDVDAQKNIDEQNNTNEPDEEEIIKLKLDNEEEVEFKQDELKEFVNDAVEFRQLQSNGVLEKAMALKDFSTEDLQLVQEILKGNAGALKKIIEDKGIDLDEIMESEEFKPEPKESGINNKIESYVTRKSKENPELIGDLNSMVSELDDQSKLILNNDDNIHIAFIEAVNSGDFQKYLNVAKIEQAKNPHLSLLEAWSAVYSRAKDGNNNNNNNKKEPKNTKDSINGNNTSNNGSTSEYEDYFNQFIQD
jgi:hypothetical protein